MKVKINDKINCMGYVYDGPLAPKHWIQFADDTALVTSLESDNQYLCNAFVSGPHGQD